MSKKPYVIQQGSNNLMIVPTENYEPTPKKKVKVDNNNFIEKVPVQVPHGSVINNVSNQVHYGASSINNNVLIDVSKVKRQPNSWAANFLQSIGGPPNKPRLYHNLATKPTSVRQENTIPNESSRTIPKHQPNNKEAHESKASALIVKSTEQPKVKKEILLPDVKIHCCTTKREVPQLYTKQIDKKPTPYQNIKSCKETVNLKSTQLKSKQKVNLTKEKVNPTKEKVNPTPRILKINDKTPERKSDIKLTQLKSNKEAYTSKAHKISTPFKANKKDTKLKTTKGIVKTKVKKETFSLKSDNNRISYLKKGDIILNLETNKTHEKKKAEFENVKNSLKKSKTIQSEVSPQKEFIKSKSPIKSVVTKINNYRSDTHYHNHSDYNPIKVKEMSFKETDADLRSKLKRKNYHHKYDEIRENSILDKKMCTIPKSKGFVPEENLIISFNAESENEEELIKKEKAHVKTKNQQTGGNKCKKIKLEINITLKHGDTTDDESIQSEDEKDDQSTHETTDVSFLDDINVDEIVDSLNDLKNNTANINTGISSNNETLHLDSKIDVKESIYIDDIAMNRYTAIIKDDTLNADVKERGDVSLLENNMEKHNQPLQSTTHSQRDASLNNSIKIEENLTNIGNESKLKCETIVKEEVPENLSKLDAILVKTAAKNQCVITETSSDCNLKVKKESENLSDSVQIVHPNKSNIKNISANSEVTLDSDQKHHENAYYSIPLTNAARNKVESLNMKTNDLLKTNKSNDGAEDIILIESDTKVEHQQNLIDNVIVDLTDTKDDIPQKEVDNDVIFIVDTKDACVIDLATEPILILDTDYDIVLNSNSDKNENNTNVSHDVVVDSSGGSTCQTNINDESKEKMSVEKLVAKDKNNSCNQVTDANNLVVLKNGTTDLVKSNTSETKSDKKTETAKVQNISTIKQAKVLNKDQSTSTNKKTVTKDNDSIPKIRNNTLINDKLAQRVEARMQSFLDEKQYLTGLIHQGRFSTLYTYEDKNGCKNTIKVLKSKSDTVNLGLDKENMLKRLQKGIPDQNLYCVRVIDGFSMSGQWCFLMEYYPKNLREVLDNQKRSFHIDVVQRLSAQLVSAVTILRNNNIIHSDIKPSHILVSGDETRLKLCGFDRAFYYDNGILLPKVGTVNYRAPELILGYPADYGIDVWSTALVMYEMATRRMLFPGSYNNDILYKQLCTLDDIPFEMHQHSKFRHLHFRGDAFSRVMGPNGQAYQLIHTFYKQERIQSVLFKMYFVDWSKHRSQSERYRDKAKLIAFSELLNQMLVIYPKQRIAIEFVFANPLVYETITTCDADVSQRES